MAQTILLGIVERSKDVDVLERLRGKALLSLLKRGIAGCNLSGWEEQRGSSTVSLFNEHLAKSPNE